MPTAAAIRQSFRFDEQAMRWRGPSGQFFPEREIKRLTITVAEVAKRDIQELTKQLYAGAIPLNDWQTRVEDALKNLHLSQAALGSGGFGGMTSSQYGKTGAILRFQYERLDGFAKQIESGEVTEGQALQRAAMYAGSGNGTYERFRNDKAKAIGMTEERRVLGASEHCPDCLEAAAEGWSPIGSLPRIGDSVCLTNCKCTFEYRKTRDTDEDS